jgi:hypothetical protein
VSASDDLGRSEQIIDASGVSERIEMLLPIGVRPRQLSVRTLLIGILLALRDERPAHLVRVHQALVCLPVADRQRLSVTCQWKSGPHLLTYRQTERTFGLIVKALTKQTPDGQPSQTLSEIIDWLLEASVQVLGCPLSSALALDWTGYESFARPPRKRRAQPAQKTGGGQEPATGAPQQSASTDRQNAGPENEQAQRQAEDAENERGQDEAARCADPEAAWGHRNVNHPGKSELFFGYYLQAATIVKEEKGPELPELVRRITLASCAHDPPAQIVPVIQRIAKDGIHLGDLLADSGYSYRESESFATPMHATGAKLIVELHPNDRGMKGTHHGAIACNGALYCPATPTTLLELSPLAPAADEQQTHEHDKRCQELSRYKLPAITAADSDGYHRVACPAARGKLRCPLREQSMTLSHEHPTILSPPDQPPRCCTQQTITVPPSVNAKSTQKHDYPSPAHRASYARRSAAERSFSQVSDPAANDVKRGWSRLMGLTPNTLLLACVFIAANMRVADAFAARQTENEQRRARGLQPHRRQQRRHTQHEPTTHANAPPALAA